MGGWECQDLSAAGSGQGLRGRHSSTYYPLVQIVRHIQLMAAELQLPAPGYILENTAFQFNWRSQQVAQRDYQQVLRELGEPMVLDAAQFGSYAHRLRNFWTNILAPEDMRALLTVVPRAPGLLVTDILSSGREPAAVASDDQPPFYPCNQRGQPRSAFPTVMAYPGTRSSRPGRPGSIYDRATGQWGELSAEERERALGHLPGSTAAPGVAEWQRRELLGRSIDLNTLAHLVALAAAVDRCRAWLQPAGRPHLAEPAVFRVVESTQCSDGVAAGLALAVTAVDPEEALMEGARQAAAADHQSGPDIWLDEHTLHLLQQGDPSPDWPDKERRRAATRASRYCWQEGQLYRRWHDGGRRRVPPPGDRLVLVRDCHVERGHFGVKRTLSLLLHEYWWHGIAAMVKAYIAACARCGRSHASFTRQQAQLSSLPIGGPGFRWHLDLAGPFPCTSAGSVYVLVAIEAFTKWAVLVPIKDKTPTSTAFAYALSVYAYYGGCAQLVTDQGNEWGGVFTQQLQRLQVDHRHTSAYHPQANGQAEAMVRTMKACLQKLCVSAHDKMEWDLKLPTVMLSYNCSRQAATRVSPFQLMHGVSPMLPAQLGGVFELPLDPTQEQAAAAFWERACLLARWGGVVWQNLLIAQHRDQLRYAAVHSGGHLPPTLQLQPGAFVYLRTTQPTGLSLPAQPVVLQVVQVRPSGVVLLQGSDGNLTRRHASQLAPCHLPNIDPTVNRLHQHVDASVRCDSCGSPDREEVMLLCDHCGGARHIFCLDPPLSQVPPGTWLCPPCLASGITVTQVQRQQELWEQKQQQNQHQPERVSSALRQAAELEGRWVRHHQPGARGRKGLVTYGRLSLARDSTSAHPKLLVAYQDGHEELVTVRGCSSKYRTLLPAGDVPPNPQSAAVAVLYITGPAPQPLDPRAPIINPASRYAAVQWMQSLPFAMNVNLGGSEQELWEHVLTVAHCPWVSDIWLTPGLRRAAAAIKRQAWWARVAVLSEEGLPAAPLSLPLVLAAVHGSASLQELVEGWLQYESPAMLCVLILAARRRVEPLLRHVRVRAQDLGAALRLDSPDVTCYAIWIYPRWAC